MLLLRLLQEGWECLPLIFFLLLGIRYAFGSFTHLWVALTGANQSVINTTNPNDNVISLAQFSSGLSALRSKYSGLLDLTLSEVTQNATLRVEIEALFQKAFENPTTVTLYGTAYMLRWDFARIFLQLGSIAAMFMVLRRRQE